MKNSLNLVFGKFTTVLKDIENTVARKPGDEGVQLKISPGNLYGRYAFPAAAGIAIGTYSFSSTTQASAPSSLGSWFTSFVKASEAQENNYFLGMGIQMKWFGVPNQAEIINLYRELKATVAIRNDDTTEFEVPLDFIPGGIAPKTYTDAIAAGPTTTGNYGEGDQIGFYPFGEQCLIMKPDRILNFELRVKGALTTVLTNALWATMNIVGYNVKPLR